MTTQAELDDRYGRTPRPGLKRTWWIIVATVAALAIGVMSWFTIAGQQYTVSGDDLGFQVNDAHSVSVKFQFVTSPNTPVTCVLEALDEEFGVVGFRVIDYAATPDLQRTFTEDIRTVGEATTGVLKGCWIS